VIRLIRRYPNRRLYDTVESRYISLDDLKKLVLGGILFEVKDSKTHEDVTRSVLLQILLDQESQSTPLFSDVLLRNLICFYGSPLGMSMLTPFLERSLEFFQQHHQQWAHYLPQDQQNPNPNIWKEWQDNMSPWFKPAVAHPLDWNPWANWFSPFSASTETKEESEAKGADKKKSD
jgi:polyhydroxyalkanoate synthesis repressor PhaR